ncbi:conserved hypothetical protein [Neospora caninum Liverpool]|uniref:Uncharacterized protein n=1 Tax=Neospora caninum (strain Liverpool) TaxID=572307 RepID=F0VBT9_NEOCL|nr:conserved hypothetical protein [Neospora caninum Liverpool]CBZ51073.1 conserved hypothetical protein [Neospora caninum Liverpool]|eukprot:XP_003881106.1 conserved hypothetical protein [Neospora caninum Liverpool]
MVREIWWQQRRHPERGIAMQRPSGEGFEKCKESSSPRALPASTTVSPALRSKSSGAKREDAKSGSEGSEHGGEGRDGAPEGGWNEEGNGALSVPLIPRHCRAPEAAAYTARLADLEQLLSRQGALHCRLALQCLYTGAEASSSPAKEGGEERGGSLWCQPSAQSQKGLPSREQALMCAYRSGAETKEQRFSRYRAEMRRLWVAREQDVFRFLRQCCTVQGLNRIPSVWSPARSSPPSPAARRLAAAVEVCADTPKSSVAWSPAARAAEAAENPADAEQTDRPERGGETRREARMRRSVAKVCGQGSPGTPVEVPGESDSQATRAGDSGREHGEHVEKAKKGEEEEAGRQTELSRKATEIGPAQPASASTLMTRRGVAFYQDLLQTNLHVAAQAADVSETATCAAALLRQVPQDIRSWRSEGEKGADPQRDRAEARPSKLRSDGHGRDRCFERERDSPGMAAGKDTSTDESGEEGREQRSGEDTFGRRGSHRNTPRRREAGVPSEQDPPRSSSGNGAAPQRKHAEPKRDEEVHEGADETRRRLALLEAACCRLFLVCVRAATKPIVSSHLPSCFGGSSSIGTNTAIVECLSVVRRLFEHVGVPREETGNRSKGDKNGNGHEEQEARNVSVGERELSWCSWLMKFSGEAKTKGAGESRNLRERSPPFSSVVKVVKEVCRELRLGNWARVLKVYVHLKSLAVALLSRGKSPNPRLGTANARASSASSRREPLAETEDMDEKETVDSSGNSRYWCAVPNEFCVGASAELLLTTLFLLEVFVSDLRVAAGEVFVNVASRQSGLAEKGHRLKEMLRSFPVGPAGAAMAVGNARQLPSSAEKDGAASIKRVQIKRSSLSSPFVPSFSPLNAFVHSLPTSIQRSLQSDAWLKEAKADADAAARVVLEERHSAPFPRDKTPRTERNGNARLLQLKALDDLHIQSTSKKKTD